MANEYLIALNEEDFKKIKQAAQDLYHFICNIETRVRLKGARDKFRVPLSAEEKEQIGELFSRGVSPFNIAQTLGRPYNTIKNHCKKKDLKPVPEREGPSHSADELSTGKT